MIQLIVVKTIEFAMMFIPANDRAGFLFAVSVADMVKADWSKEKITEEVLKALDAVWKNKRLLKGQQ